MTDAVQRFFLEARAVNQIRHPHIVDITDFNANEGGEAYYVMEFLEGETLGSLIRRRQRLDVGESVDLMLDACEAIAEAHTLGIVHRDLKPENLFLVPASDPTLRMGKVLVDWCLNDVHKTTASFRISA